MTIDEHTSPVIKLFREAQVNEVARKKLKNMIENDYANLETLFLNYPPYSVKSFISSFREAFYVPVVLLAKKLELIFTSSLRLNEKGEGISRIRAIRESVREYLAECLLKDIDHSGKILINKTLDELCAGDLLALLKQENQGLDLAFEEVKDNLPDYLLAAVSLADYPEFLPVYFTYDEIKPVATQFAKGKYNPQTRYFVKYLLTEAKKQQILDKLEYFIQTIPLHHLAKYAYSIKISLGTTYSWEEHPFIKRLFANSYLEYLIKKETRA